MSGGSHGGSSNINFGGKILCSVETTTLAGGLSSLFSYSLAAATTAAVMIVAATTAADATTVVDADNSITEAAGRPAAFTYIIKSIQIKNCLFPTRISANNCAILSKNNLVNSVLKVV